jgi:hypothetical protein
MRIRKWLVFLSVWVIAAIMLSGCLGVKTPPVSRAVPPSIFVDYQRSGGIAGVDDRLVIFDNGIAVISGKTTNTELVLNQTDLERISELFSQNQFSMLQGNYTSRRGGADFLRYRVSYHGKTVNTEDSATPPSLQPILDELNRILSMGLSTGPTSTPILRIGS